MIEAGTAAPDFTLSDQDENEVSLADLRGGKVLLVFYPMDFSPTCSDQLAIYQEVLSQIEDEDVTVLGISTDNVFAHRAFREHLNTTITLLADFHPKGEVTKAYGAYIESRGHPNRSLVLIDEQGEVIWVHEAETPLQIPGANLIFDALAQARVG